MLIETNNGRSFVKSPTGTPKVEVLGHTTYYTGVYTTKVKKTI